MTRNAFILAFVACALSALMLYDGHNWGGDFSQYIAQSIALIDDSIDSQISNNTWIIQNSFYGLGPFIYPWGTSLIIAPIYKIFGFDLVAFKLPFCVLFGAFVFAFYRFCDKSVGAKYAIIASLIFALNPLFLHFSNNIISDIPFMLFSFVSVVCLAHLFSASSLCGLMPNRGGGQQDYLQQDYSSQDYSRYILEPHDNPHDSAKSDSTPRYPHNSQNLHNSQNPQNPTLHDFTPHKNPLSYAILGGIFASFAYATRNNGIVIILALLLCHAMLIFAYLKARIKLDRFRIFCHALPYLIFILVIFTLNCVLGVGGSGHLELLSQISLKSIVRNGIYYVFIFGEFFTLPSVLSSLGIDFKYSFLLPNLGFIFVALAFPLILRGVRICFIKEPLQTIFIMLFVLGSVAMLVLWPALQGIRFVFCIIPFMIYFGIVGFVACARFKTTAKVLFIAVMSLFIIKDSYAIYVNIQNDFRHKAIDAYSTNAKAVYEFIRQNLPSDSKIIFFKPRVLYLNTNRLSFYPLKDEDFLKGDFVLEYLPIKDENPLPQNPQNKARLIKVYENSEFILYKMPTFSS